MYNRLSMIYTMRNKEAESPVKQERRRFLARCLKWAGGIVVFSLVYPLFRFLGYTIKPKPRYISVPAPLPLSGYHAERDFILFGGPKAPFAVSRTCTHLGCRVSYLEDRQIIECPCHQSRFTPQGNVLNGPAKQNLRSLAVEIHRNDDGSIKNYVITL